MSRRRFAWVVSLVVAAGLVIALGPLAVVAFAGSGLDPRIPASLRVAPSIAPALVAHSQLFARRIERVGRRVYVAIGYGLANIIWIEGDAGVIVVDTGENVEQARAVLGEIRARTPKPIAAVILTHHHADHVLGTRAFVGDDDTIPILAHASLLERFADENGRLAELETIRGVHMYGAALGPADKRGGNAGIGPYMNRGTPGFVAPTRTFDDALLTSIAGVKLDLVWAPSEAESELAVYLPDDKVLLSAEVVQDHAFPNLYTIRGARFRDPLRWISSLDLLRGFDAEAMALQHGPPVLGREAVARVLTVYRDEIQYVHDQTVRLMNQGLTPDELAAAIHLPPALADARPWSAESYGTVANAVRGIYGGYVGWFAGDPTAFHPLPPVEHARRMIALAGGRARILAEARHARTSNDDVFAAELLTWLIRVDGNDMEARHLKAAAFRRLGYADSNAPYRNYYLVSAMELDGQVPESLYLALASRPLGSALPDLPAPAQVALLPTRLQAEKVLDDDFVARIVYRDAPVEATLHLRHGVLAVEPRDATPPTFTLGVTRAAMGALLLGGTLDEALRSGDVTIDGDAEPARRLFTALEKPFAHKPEVVLR